MVCLRTVAGRFATWTLRYLNVSLPGRFATWTFRTFGRLDTRTFRYLPGRFATCLKACNLWYCLNFSKSFLYLTKGSIKSHFKLKHVCHCIANGIGVLHEPERAAYATFCNRNALLKSTIWQLRSIKLPKTRTFSSNTLPKSYYMNVEFNEKFDKRNCPGQWHNMSSLSCYIKKPIIYVS